MAKDFKVKRMVFNIIASFFMLSVLIPAVVERSSATAQDSTSLVGTIQIAETPMPITSEGKTIGMATASQPTITLVFSPDLKSLNKVVVHFKEIKLSMSRTIDGVKYDHNVNRVDASYVFDGPCVVSKQLFNFSSGKSQWRGKLISSKEAKGTVHLVIVDYLDWGSIELDYRECQWQAKR